MTQPQQPNPNDQIRLNITTNRSKSSKVAWSYQYNQAEMMELRKCSKDPIYFIKNYVKIVTLDKGVTLFELWPFQEKMIESFHNERNSIVLAGRQVGKSTVCTAYYVWAILFQPNYVIALLANKALIAKELLDRAKKMIELLPDFLYPQIKTWNVYSLVLKNGSKILAAATSSSAIRGMSINCLHLDEFAHIQDNIAEDFFTSVYPTISSGTKTKCIIVSTPRGFNYFQKMWTKAEKRHTDPANWNGFNPVLVHWSDHPHRDDQWKADTLAKVGEMIFAQEYDCDFIGSSNTLIPGRYYRQMVAANPIKESKQLTVYEEPQHGHTYLIVADPSRGTGNDNTAFIIFDITEYPIKIAATFRDPNMSPIVLPQILERIAQSYNHAYILVETNDNGQQVTDILWRDMEYENVVIFGFNNSENLGVRTTKIVKSLGCSNFKDMVENQKLLINDANLISEISTFVQKKKSYEAEVGCYDDLVMCCVLLGWYSTTQDFKHITDGDLRAEIHKKKLQEIEEDIVPFGFIVGGQELGFDQDKVIVDRYGDVWIFDDDYKN